MNSKRKPFILLLTFLAIAAVVVNRRKHEPVEVRAVSVERTHLSATAKSFQGLSKEFKAIHDAPSNEECELFNDVIARQPTETSLYDLNDKKLRLPTTCEVRSEGASKLYMALVDKCNGDARQKKPQDCTMALFMYRSEIIDHLTQTQDIKDLSTDILVQKFFGLMFGNTLGAQSAEAKQVVEELRARLPDSPGVDRMDVMRLMAQDNVGKNHELDVALAKARQDSPDDTSLFEVQLMNEREKNFADYANDVQAQYEKDSNSPIAVYHMGCVSWKHQQRNEAIQYFTQASKLAPDERRFADTLAKSLTDPFTNPVCSVTMGVDPDQI